MLSHDINYLKTESLVINDWSCYYNAAYGSVHTAQVAEDDYIESKYEIAIIHCNQIVKVYFMEKGRQFERNVLYDKADEAVLIFWQKDTLLNFVGRLFHTTGTKSYIIFRASPQWFALNINKVEQRYSMQSKIRT